MTDLDNRALGERIREARLRMELTQDQLAEAAGLGERTVVNKIESGVRKVSALELADIAEALGVRMTTFFTEPIPSIVSHRASQNQDAVDATIDRLLASLASDVDLLESVVPRELGLRSLEPLVHPATMAEAERLGFQVREMLQMTADEPMYDVASYAASLGLLVFACDLGPDTADAGTVMLRAGGVSLINSHNKVGRRRLAAGHELGHYVIADEYTVDWRVATQGGDIEPRIDRFARALLLPPVGVQKAFERLSESFALREVAVNMASLFRVDMATLARRLQELNVVNAEEAALVKVVRTTREDIEEFGLNINEELAGTFLPVTFRNAVLKAVVDQKISRQRALDLLLETLTEDELPTRRLGHPDEIWKYVS